MIMIVWELCDPGSSDSSLGLYMDHEEAMAGAARPWPGQPPISIDWRAEASEVPGVAQYSGSSSEGYEYMIYPREVF